MAMSKWIRQQLYRRVDDIDAVYCDEGDIHSSNNIFHVSPSPNPPSCLLPTTGVVIYNSHYFCTSLYLAPFPFDVFMKFACRYCSQSSTRTFRAAGEGRMENCVDIAQDISPGSNMRDDVCCVNILLVAHNL